MITSRNASPEWTAFARIYFGVAVLVGGNLGVSLGNAVFVDQMMADNNDDVERDVLQMAREVSLLRAEIRNLRELLGSRSHRDLEVTHDCSTSQFSTADDNLAP